MYRHAHWYVLAITMLTMSGFVPTYFMRLESAMPRHHLHVAAATAWLLLLFVQPLLANRGLRGWHRTLGLSSLVVFPILAATSAYMLWYASSVDVAKGGVYPRLYWFDFWTIPGMTLLWLAGLARRRQTEIHQRCMLLTLVALAPPGYGRAIFFYGIYPLGGSFDDVWHPMMISMTAVLLFLAYRERGRYWPTTAALGLVALLYVSAEIVADAEWWHNFLHWFGNPPANYQTLA